MMIQTPRLDPDGLRLPTQLTLAQLANDAIVQPFAAGLVTQALKHSHFLPTLAEALHYPGSETHPLLATLLILDAEVEAVIGGGRRTFPLPGFLSYRANLPLQEFPLSSVRLPSLNPDSHFFFLPTDPQAFLILRLDLQPLRKVMGHVRLATSRPTQIPQRLHIVEHRLERQTLTESCIERAIAASNEDVAGPLSLAEQAKLREVLGELGAG